MIQKLSVIQNPIKERVKDKGWRLWQVHRLLDKKFSEASISRFLSGIDENPRLEKALEELLRGDEMGGDE